MSGFLLDTNVISEAVKPKPSHAVIDWLDSIPEDLLYLSVLTLGEIRKGIAALPPNARRAGFEAWLNGDLRVRFAGRILPIDPEVADRWGSILGKAHAKSTPVPVIDALLAATAIHHNLTFVTRNVRHVACTGARFFDPWVE